VSKLHYWFQNPKNPSELILPRPFSALKLKLETRSSQVFISWLFIFSPWFLVWINNNLLYMATNPKRSGSSLFDLAKGTQKESMKIFFTNLKISWQS